MDRTQSWVFVVVTAAVTALTGLVAGAAGIAPLLSALSAGTLGIATAGLLARLSGSGTQGSANGTPRSVPGDASLGTTGRELLANLPLSLILVDGSRMVSFANAAASDLFGQVSRGEPLSSIIRSPSLADTVTAVASGEVLKSVEFTHMRAREQRVLLAHVCAIAGHDPGSESTVMILIEDHTRPARIEQMRRDFIANASHELKTPLAAIVGFIETLQGSAKHDPQAFDRFLPIMAREAERMTRLVEDLMSLNRIEMNEHVRPSGKVQLGDLLRETAAAVSQIAEAAGVQVEIDLPDPGPEVIGDRDELSQLFLNLIDNAIKYGGSGGLVSIALAPAEAGRGRMCGISVTDHGPGIARQHIPRLTERFYRVSDARSGAKGGTGLGLSIVKHILNRHRGDLTIRSEPGKGASFTAWLPRAAESI